MSGARREVAYPFNTDWQNRWSAKGLLAECRRLWALLDEQPAEIAHLKALAGEADDGK